MECCNVCLTFRIKSNTREFTRSYQPAHSVAHATGFRNRDLPTVSSSLGHEHVTTSTSLVSFRIVWQDEGNAEWGSRHSTKLGDRCLEAHGKEGGYVLRVTASKQNGIYWKSNPGDQTSPLVGWKLRWEAASRGILIGRRRQRRELLRDLLPKFVRGKTVAPTLEKK